MKKRVFHMICITMIVCAYFLLVQNEALADQCGTCQDSSGKFVGGTCLNGTPVPQCPGININANTQGTTSTVTVHSDTQPAPQQQPTVATVVVTATPIPTVVPRSVYRYYQPVVIPTKIAPSVKPRKAPTPTGSQKKNIKSARSSYGFFQNIEGFFQGFEGWFRKL